MKLKSIIIGLALVGAALLSEARMPRQSRDGGRVPPVSGGIGTYQPGGQIVSRQIYIGRYMRDEVVPLNQVLPMPGGYETAVIESIEVDLRDGLRGALTLMVDGLRGEFEGRLNPHTIIRPTRLLELGRTFRSLGLLVNGRVFVDRITVNYFTNTGNPNPGNFAVTQDLHRVLYNFNSTDLGFLFRLEQYRGYRIVAIEIETRNLDSRGVRLSLLANGQMHDERYVRSNTYELTSLFLRNSGVIGRDVNSLTLLTDGSVILEKVTLRLAR